MATPFRVVADAAQRIAEIRSHLARCGLVASLLHAVDPDELEPATHLLTGTVIPVDVAVARANAGVVWRALERIFVRSQSELRHIANTPLTLSEAAQLLFATFNGRRGAGKALTVNEVYAALRRLANLPLTARKEQESTLFDVLSRASPNEAALVVRSFVRDGRWQPGEELVLEGIALAGGTDPELVRRCFMFLGDAGMVAQLALTEGAAALERFEVTVFTPLRPMLAQHVLDLPAAWTRLGGQFALEYLLDGARVQIHLAGREVRLFTRHLMEITAALPEIAATLPAHLHAQSAILDGEVVAVDVHGRALPFHDLLRRFRRVGDMATLLRQVAIRLYLFDALYLDGEPLIDYPYIQRWQQLRAVVRPNAIVTLTPRLIPVSVEESIAFYQRAVEDGHAGVIAKRLDGTYLTGTHGAGWMKVDEAITVTLAAVAAEWGCGEDVCWLSNYHLAARDDATGKLVPVGRATHALAPPEFAAMLHALRIDAVAVPRVAALRHAPTVEVALGGIMPAIHPPDGIMLRFARILRFRATPPPDGIASLQYLRTLSPAFDEES